MKSSPILLIFLLISTISAYSETLEVQAQDHEAPQLLWVNKGDTILFSVSGTWTMWDQWEATNWEGHKNFKKINNFYLGTLLCHVQGGPEFAVKNKGTYKSPVSGLLLLYPNRKNYEHLNAQGTLTVEIQGATKITYEEAEQRYGWDLNQIDTARSVSYLNSGEKDVVQFINKARTNPRLFANLYLTHLLDQGEAYQECYGEMQTLSALPALQPSRTLSSAARDHASDMGDTGRTGHLSSSGETLNKRVERYGNWGKILGENCSYNFDQAVDIVIQLLVDDGVPGRGHRRNILNQEYKYLGTAIHTHTMYEYNCVQDFAGEISD